jgi:hypothetical protein
MRKGLNLRVMRRCGELRMQGLRYRDIQREIGAIGYKTVRRYCKMYIAMMVEIRQQCWNVLKQAAIQAETPQLLISQH